MEHQRDHYGKPHWKKTTSNSRREVAPSACIVARVLCYICVIYVHLTSMCQGCSRLCKSRIRLNNHTRRGSGLAQAVENSAVKVWNLLHGGSVLHSGCICCLGYFLFQPVVHHWSIKGYGMCCPVCGKVHVKDSLLLIGKSSLCGDSGFNLKKYVTMTIYLHIESMIFAS